jgi:acetylornithine deacetylase
LGIADGRVDNADQEVTRVDAISILRTLVGFDTTSRLSNLALTDWAVAYLKEFGARIRLTWDDDRSKANILASFGPDRDGGVVLSGHTDVVPVDGQDWMTDPFELVECSGRLHGRGTVDMKGFVACCLAAVPNLARARLHRPIHLALSYDEEVGCLGVPRLIADLLSNIPKPAMAIVGEPTEMCVGDRHRGFFGQLTTFLGKAAHSSDPAAGASAIYPASAFIRFLETMGGKTGRGINDTTFNVGRVSGGSSINIVPSHCEVLWEFRPAVTADVDALYSAFNAFLRDLLSQGVSVDNKTVISVPQLVPQRNGPAVEFAQALTGEHPTVAMPFATEAGFFQEAGISAVVCGPGSIEQAHQPNEWITIDQLEKADAFLGRLVDWASSELPATEAAV